MRFLEFDGAGYTLPGGPVLLAAVSFAADPGDTVVVLGRSGAGKSTTLKLVNRLLDPTAGRVLVEGRSTTDWDPIRLRRRTGYAIQEIGLFPHFTVASNVALVPQLEGWPEPRRRARVAELLELVGLDPPTFAERMPSELSGGQRQRVGIARALAADPPLLLLDEPFGALDPVTRSGLRREFQALAARLGKATLFVTHDVAEALFLATTIVLLEHGRVAFAGPPEAFRRSDAAEARAFLEAS